MLKLINILALTLFAKYTFAAPWSCISTGLDSSVLYWNNERHTAWSFQTAFGPRIIDNFYFKAKVSIPIPFFLIIGNQMNAGGELSYLTQNPNSGFALETSLGAAWTATWPKDIIIILADGDTTTPPPPEDFEDAHGMRYELLTSFGYQTDQVIVWLDLGLDHRRLSVRRDVNNEIEEGEFTFTGPHLGISADIFFGN